MAEPPSAAHVPPQSTGNDHSGQNPQAAPTSESAGDWHTISTMTSADLLGHGSNDSHDSAFQAHAWNAGPAPGQAGNDVPVDDWWHEVDVDPDFLDEDDRLRDITGLAHSGAHSESSNQHLQHSSHEVGHLELTESREENADLISVDQEQRM